MDTPDDGVQDSGAEAVPAQDDELAALRATLESAGDLCLDDRLTLLQRTESTIAGALEGLDGL